MKRKHPSKSAVAVLIYLIAILIWKEVVTGFVFGLCSILWISLVAIPIILGLAIEESRE